ncbi:MAG: hypothetical protein HDS97_03745 [Bacteroidales bacterium]|nr:hypothetical protein [Bacteroidales bacterium]
MKHNWEYRRLGDICSFIGGGTPSKANSSFYCGDIPWATVRDMGDFNLSETELHITQDAIKQSATNLLPKGMIVISTHVGLGKICELTQDTAINQDLKGVAFIQHSVNKYYFVQWYRSIADYIIANGRGATVKGVTLDFMKNLSIPVPPMETQEQIVAELDQIHDLIAKNRELLSQLDALTKSLFYDIFGDPSVNPKSFPLCALSDICDAISIGITYKPEMVAEDGTIVLRSSNIQESKFVLDDIVRVQMQLKASQYVKKNDILMCSRNGSARLVGKVCLIPDLNEKMSWGAFMTIIRSKHFRFLFHYFRLPAFREQLKKTKTSTVNQITIGMLKSIKLPFPPLALQEDFAAKVEAIEAQKAKVEAEIAELQTLLDARMDYWFN